jgi:hypothetical protein
MRLQPKFYAKKTIYEGAILSTSRTEEQLLFVELLPTGCTPCIQFHKKESITLPTVRSEPRQATAELTRLIQFTQHSDFILKSATFLISPSLPLPIPLPSQHQE